MAKRKKDAISKRPDEAIVSKKKPARFKASAEEARNRTNSVKEMFTSMGKLWWELGAEVKSCIDDFVPEALGLKATEWFKSCFGDSWLKVYRAHRAVAALPGVPQSKLEKITEGNAYQLARLPKQLRAKPEWIEKAINLPNEEFKEVVEKKRTPKGFKRDPMVKWNEIFRITSVPKSLAKVMEDALKLAAKNGDFDLDEKEGRINALELIFSEFITSQAQPVNVFVDEGAGRSESPLESQQAEEAGALADQTFGGEPDPDEVDIASAADMQEYESDSHGVLSEVTDTETVEQRPRRGRKASAA